MIKAKAERLVMNYFQLPNTIVDDLLADMSGAEIKCYLFVIRKTRGWQKTSDAISISQFMQATGLGNNAVISACASLVERGLLSRSQGARGVAIYSLDVAHNDTHAENPPVGKVHSTCGKSTQVTCGKSTHTKDTIKNTTLKTTTAASAREATRAEQADPSGSQPSTNKPTTDTRIDVVMCAEWEPSSAFATYLKMAMFDPAKLTEFTLTKFRMHNLGKVQKQNQWEVALLNWLKGESDTTMPKATVPRRKASRHNNLEQQEHVTGSF